MKPLLKLLLTQRSLPVLALLPAVPFRWAQLLGGDAVGRRHRPLVEVEHEPEDSRSEVRGAGDQEGEKKRLIDDYEETFANPYRAASLGYLDDVIQPRETRAKLTKALGALLEKEEIRPARKHGNIPL